MMFRKLVVPALAVAGFAGTGFVVAGNRGDLQPAAPFVEPPAAPFVDTVAGAGLVEASTENVAVGAPVPGVVLAVAVHAGAAVAAGDVLFTVDDRAARAEVVVREAALGRAVAEVARLRGLPRAEDVPPLAAKLAEAAAELADRRVQIANVTGLADPRAASREEIERRRHAAEAAEAHHAAAEAELARLRAGAWAADLAIADAAVREAEAALAAARTEVERRTVRAPFAGQVLQLRVRAGEFVTGSHDPNGEPLLLLGATTVLHVRVDVDEADAWRLRPEAPAVVSLRGNPRLRAPLRFVHLEPYVIPKKSLTGASRERIDTRVLQVVYAFDRGALPAYVGQQVDVFVDVGDGR